MLNELPLELAQMDVRPGTEVDFVRELQGVIALIAAAPGCHGVSLFRSLEHPSRFRLMVRWTRVEDHLAFRSSASVQLVRAVFARHVAARAETEHLICLSTTSPGSEP